ncbi:DNA gyrase inhibitor YacG [Stagnimonas aquatica]|uniref:DNA gyrase inhibitor YacG n=1 Tax=Stagnimonas aquatica TaxID=2689987 RepID=A0A3N0VN47_9GAMM|nr:DNA gyrase inhibitor YacG [Stagnimonas aquatica]ROH93408.1 DNA gyrase inhibitor YacG [Stagnimonas aquatica]
MNPPRIGACPTCRKSSSLEAGNPWRPFCSERCKLIDLGAWASGRYSIPVVESDEAEPRPSQDDQ